MVNKPSFAMVSFYRPLSTQNNIDTCEVRIETSTQTENKNKFRCTWPSKYMPSLQTICVFVIVLPLVVGLSVFLVVKNLTPVNSTKGHNIISAEQTLRMVTRKEWGALPPKDKLKELELPVDIVIINDTASNNCTTQDACILQIRAIQTLNMRSQFLDDIQYNFLVGGDGVAYEGRGWDKMGGDAIDSNITTIVIALIGKFANRSPPKRQLKAAKLLIQKGVILNKVARNYKLVPSANFGDKPVERLVELNIHN